MRKLLIIIFLNCTTVFANTSYSPIDTSIILRGTVLNERSEPIPYVSIGIAEKAIGTISDEYGNFLLKIPMQYQSHAILFSSIGYENYSIHLNEIKDDSNLKIYLSSKTTQLQQVIVKPLKTEVLGNTSTSKLMNAGFESDDLGTEAGLKVKVKHKPSLIENVNFHISKNDFDTLIFRLNIYILKDDVPTDNILPENVLCKIVNKQTGRISLDLSNYNLELNDDVLISLELIKRIGQANKNIITLPATLLGGPVYLRKTSQDKWKIVKGLGIGINMGVKY